MTKRIIALLISVMMVVTLLPAGVFAFDAEPSDTIVHQNGIFFDGAEEHPLDGTPIKALGEEGFAESFSPVPEFIPGSDAPIPETLPASMSLLFEVSNIKNPVTFGKFRIISQGTGGQWIDSNNSGNYSMEASFTIPESGQYALQVGFNYVNWTGNGHYASIKEFTLFGGSRGVNLVSENPAATVKLVGVVAGTTEYDVVFCGEDGGVLGTAQGTLQPCSTYSVKIGAVPSLKSLYTGEVPTKAETDEFRYEYDGWQTADGTPVDYANFSGKVYPRFKEIDKTKATVTFKDGDGFTLGTKTVKIGEGATYDGEAPTKQEDDDNTYEWTGGWDIDLSVINEDVVATAQFNTVPKPKYVITVPESVTNDSVMPIQVNPINFDGMTSATMTLNYNDKLFKFKECDSSATVVSDENGVLTLSLTAQAANGFNVTFDVPYEAFKGPTTLTTGGTLVTDGEKTVYEYSANLTVEGLIPGFFAENDQSGTMVPQAPVSEGSVTLYQNDAPGFITTYCYTLIFKVENLDAPLTIGRFNMSAFKRNGQNHPYAWSANWDHAAYNYPSIISFPEDGLYYYTVNSILGGLVEPTIGLRSATAELFVNGDWEVGKDANNRNIAVPTAESAPLQAEMNKNATVQVLAVLEGNFNPVTTYYNSDGTEYGTTVCTYNSRGDTGSWAKAEMLPLTSYSDDYLANYETPTMADPEKPYLRYDFKGWADKDGNPVTHIYRSAKVYASYDIVDTRPDCTIKFMNGDEEYETQIVKETEMPVRPKVDPTKPSTDLYSYIFKGWDANGDGEVDEITAATVEGATYTAVYEQVDRRWEVKFYAEDKETYLGSIYVLGEIKDGTTPTAPEKPADVQYSYTFDKWVYEDGSELVESEVTQDVSVYPSYTPTLNKYTVTYLNDDGTELAKVTVDYGTAATTDEPTKEKDEYYTYTFSGWDADTSNVVGDMTVTATYTKVFSKFADVPADEWYTKQVEYVTVHNYFSGMSDTTFEPDTVATRAMVLRVLYSAAGKPSIEGLTNPFKDVPADEWYAPAVIWGFNAGVAYGKSETEFDPDGTVLREEFCSFIYRFAEKVYLIDGKHVDMSIPKSDVTSSLSTFKDKNDIDSWAQASIRWCKYAGIVRGTDTDNGTFFYPRNGLTRAELATMIKGYFESDKLVPVAGE